MHYTTSHFLTYIMPFNVLNASCTSRADHPHLHSFPTRRSSDLHSSIASPAGGPGRSLPQARRSPPLRRRAVGGARRGARERSEEHTSELQSPCNIVCRLLLEKKKKLTYKGYTASRCFWCRRLRN